MLHMIIEYSKGVLFVRLNGFLNRETSYKINNYLIPVLIKQKVNKLVFNLEKLLDVDETGIDALLNTKGAILENKGKFVLCCNNSLVNKKLNITKLRVYNDESSAYEMLGA